MIIKRKEDGMNLESSKEQIEKENALTESEFIKQYDSSKYEKPSVTVDIMVFTVIKDKLCVLLIKRGRHPFKDAWAIPGGFINMDEDADTAAKRELEEETKVTGVHLEQLYTFSSVHRDPRMRVISISYIAIVPYNKLQYAYGDDASDSRIFEIRRANDDVYILDSLDYNIRLSKSDLAFDHYEILKTAIKRLEGKLDYTDIAIDFLLDKNDFSMNEILWIYKAISGKEYSKPNFARDFKARYQNRLVKTGQEKSNHGKPVNKYSISDK